MNRREQPKRRHSRFTPGWRLGIVFLMLAIAGRVAVTTEAWQEATPPATEDSEPRVSLAAQSEREALGRARLLHETIHGALQVVHRDFFDDESPRVLPSQSLDDVFAELAEQFDVRVRWLTVNADEMNVAHRPATEFERDAVERIEDGAEYVSEVRDGQLQYVGRIVLRSQCLKCHVNRRTSLEDRFSGLGITLSIQAPTVAAPEPNEP